MSTIADALAAVRERIALAATRRGRSASDITLVAVSKTKPPEAIREAYAAGQRAFGENYAQELVAKATHLADLKDLDWHFVGHLQTNKAKAVAGVVRFVHTVGTAALARELGKRVAALGVGPLPVLIEVNVGGEPQKHGCAASEIDEVMAAIRAQEALTLRGLMTVPPAENLDAARRAFETLSSLRTLHGGAAALPDLSMGMTHDLETAIACGATIVRVGTAIFGPRSG
jgi:pyridoxal phosphate enzyme (YggS family)